MSRNGWIDIAVDRFFTLYFGVIVAALLCVNYLFGYLAAAGGLYTLGGALVAWFIYRDTDGPPLPEVATDRLFRLAIIILCAGIVISSLTKAKVFPLLLVTVTGYAILSLQIICRPTLLDTEQTLATLLALFAFIPLSKILTIEFYFGSGDIPSHVRAVQELLASGSVAAISQRGYDAFPGLHIITGSLSDIIGVTPHDSLLILGLFVYVWFLLLVYLLVRRVVGNDHIALFSAIVLSTMPAFSYFSSYFFPQSFAVPVLVCLFLVLHMYGATGRTEFVVISYFLVGAAVISHHFSIVVVLPILLSMALLVRGINGTGNTETRPSLRLSPLIVAGLVTLGYWVYVGEQFIIAFTGYSAGVLSEPLFSSGGEELRTTYNYGSEVFYGMQSADGLFEQLLVYSNLYYLAVFSLFTLGLVYAMRNRERYRRITPWLVISIASGAFLFKTPLVFKSIQRVNHGLVTFFVLILGIGLFVAVSERARVTAAVVVLILGVTGPVVAADNLYSIHSEAQPQTDFSENEYAQLSAVSTFSKNYEPSISTFWATRRMLFHFGVAVPGRVELRYQKMSIDGGAFLYRTKWAKHKVFVKENPIYFNKATMAADWLNTAVNSSNKVYASGKMGLLWDDNPYNVSGYQSQ